MISALLDILFPPVCLLCGQSSREKGFCDCCKALFEKRRISGPACTVCGTPFPSPKAVGHACGRCSMERPAFLALRSAFVYDGPVLEAIHRLKYGRDVSLAGPLARAAVGSLDIRGPFVVVPVPLWAGKLRERGFNQSLLVAREVCRLTGSPLEFMGLMRSRDTGQQVGRKADERRRNVAGAFGLVDRAAFSGKRALLVDDVATTGATLNECARVLKRAGAEVFALTVARAARL